MLIEAHYVKPQWGRPYYAVRVAGDSRWYEMPVEVCERWVWKCQK